MRAWTETAPSAHLRVERVNQRWRSRMPFRTPSVTISLIEHVAATGVVEDERIANHLGIRNVETGSIQAASSQCRQPIQRGGCDRLAEWRWHVSVSTACSRRYPLCPRNTHRKFMLGGEIDRDLAVSIPLNTIQYRPECSLFVHTEYRLIFLEMRPLAVLEPF